MRHPTTAEVLAIIGRRGVVVGSYPANPDAKDVDVVVGQQNPEARTHPVFDACLTAWPRYCKSVVCGHLWVQATPTPVEIFEEDGWPPEAPAKVAGMVSYRQAVRRSEVREILGVRMRVLCPEK